MGREQPRPVVDQQSDGTFVLHLDPQDVQLVVRLLGRYRDVLVEADPTSPGLRRLFPAAYHADPDADAEYQRLMRDELVASRLAGAEAVAEALRQPTMTAEQLHGLLQAVNGLRLVLGTMLDVGEDDDDDVDPDHPNAPEMDLYHWLSWLLDVVVDALSRGLA